jgi:hypothetical protein
MALGLIWVSGPARAAVMPIGYIDRYAASLGDTISVSAPGVLGNDFGVSSNYKAELLSTDLGHGTIDFHSDGSFTFDPNDNGRGEFDFRYCIVAGSGDDCVSDPTRVQLFNGEPYVPDHSYSISSGAVLDVDAPGLLADAQNRTTGDYLYVTNQPDFGTLDADKSGAFTYTPPPGFVGTDTFGYCISNDEDVPRCEGLNHMIGTVSVYPAANAQSFSVTENDTYSGRLYPSPRGGITFTGLVTTAAQHGSVDVSNDGTFTYTPATGYTGPDSFAFCISQDDQNCVAGAGSATVSITVNPLTVPTTTAVAAPSQAIWGTSITITATVTPSAATGTVAFTDAGSPITNCAAVPVSDGSASCTPAGPLPVGAHTFAAAFTGGGLYLDSTSAPVTTTVTRAPTTLTYTGATTAVAGSSFPAAVTLTRTAGVAGPLPGQAITFAAGAGSCTAITDGAGSASCSLDAATPGPLTVAITYDGDAQDQPADTSTTVQVSAIPSATTVVAAPSQAIWDTSITITATVAPSTGGTVAFTVADAPIAGCTDQPVDAGTATCITNSLPVGADDVTATYSGDTTHSGSSGHTTVTITARPTTVSYTGATSATVGQPATVSALLVDTASGEALSGRLVKFARGPLTCTSTTASDGSASCQVTPTAISQAGPVTVSYAGETHYLASQASASMTVAPAPTTVDVSAPAVAVFSTAVTVTATVSPSDGSGTVDFAEDGTDIGCTAVPLVATGSSWQATCTTTALPVGSDQITASFGGTADYLPASGTATTQVTAAPTALTYTGTTDAVVAAPLTVSAELTNVAGAPVPISGQSLTFTLADLSCTATTGVDGTASCSLVASDVKQSGTLTVSYAATTDYLASRAEAAVSFAAAPTTTTVRAPAAGTFSVPMTISATVAPSAGTGTVDFSTGTPADPRPLDGCTSVPLSDGPGGWQATCTTTELPVGADTVFAAYSGDSSYLPSTGSADTTVQIAPTALAYTGASKATVGTAFPVSARLTVTPAAPTAGLTAAARRPAFAALAALDPPADPTSIPVPGQPVTFTLGSASCQARTTADGTAGCSITPTAAARAARLSVSFAGTSEYLPAATSAAINVARARSTVTTGPRPSTATAGASPAPAATGSDIAGLGGIAAALLLLGTALTVASRAPRTRDNRDRA